MIIIIPMGGNAERLGSPDIPKPLTDISNGKTVLDYALEPLLRKYKDAILVPILPYEADGEVFAVNERRMRWSIKLAIHFTTKYPLFKTFRYFQDNALGVINALEIACEELWYYRELASEPVIVVFPDTIQLEFPIYLPEGNWITVANKETEHGGLVEIDSASNILNISDDVKYPFCEGQLTPSAIYHFRSLTLLSRAVSNVSESGYTNISDLIRYLVTTDHAVSAIHVGQMIDVGTPEQLERARKRFGGEK
jgi:NDP-sugar pyrophosphorylase family protein